MAECGYPSQSGRLGRIEFHLSSLVDTPVCVNLGMTMHPGHVTAFAQVVSAGAVAAR